METREALLVDAFAVSPMAGNPAGVVPRADGLSADQMGRIANELGASETAFVFEDGSSGATVEIRYFTPKTEVDLCGHATVAALSALHDTGELSLGEATIETAVGPLAVEVESDGRVWMEQGVPSVSSVEVDLETVAGALGVDSATLRDVGADLPLATASTGMPYLVVPVNFLEHLSGASPDFAAIESLAEQADAVGVYAFTFDTLEADSRLHARAFLPGAGIPEDPVTGTGAGAVAAYLDRHAGIDVDEGLRVEQGHFIDRPGYVDVEIDSAADATVRVGGRAVTVFDGRLVVPAAEDDDILEA